MVEGRCLCGEVTVTLDHAPGEISGCFCDLCTRWGGGLQMGMEAPAEAVRIEGPVKTHRSSRLAERGWCDTCGSALWLRNVDGPDTGVYEFLPGLFENAGGARLTRVVYADCAPDGFSLAGDHDRISRTQYEAENPHLNEEV